ncbi:MAG TPA: arabinose-proton symporter [Planctomycetes bacterium]|nr:arabinose-proton symporter [Planctomycetota bacterium]
MKDAAGFRFIAFLGLTAGLAGLLFGFDIAIIAGAGPFLLGHFGLGDIALGWAYSSLLFGCIAGAAIAGRLADTFGRRRILLAVAALFALTSAATGLAPSFALFIAARFLGGLAVGGASIIAPMYTAEVSPAALRGRMCAFYQLSITFGILVSYCINYALHDVGPWNWRWMFMSGAIPAAVFIAMILRAPETPRFLCRSGRRDEALALLSRISGAARAAAEIAEIEASLAGRGASWRELRSPGLSRALLVGFVLAILVHCSGINTIIDYAPKIMESAGWGIDAALFSTFVIGITNFLFTLVSFWVIDRHGRRPLYIAGSLGMTAALAALTVVYATKPFEGMTTAGLETTGVVVLGLMMLFIAFFAACIGPVFWTLVPEIFPNRVRGIAMAVPVLTQWGANAVVVLFFPYAFNQIGKAPTFAFLGAMALAQALFTWKFVPETKHKTLEEIEEQWSALADRVQAGNREKNLDAVLFPEAPCAPLIDGPAGRETRGGGPRAGRPVDGVERRPEERR